MTDFERVLQLLAVITTMAAFGTVLYIGARYALARIRRIENDGGAARVDVAAEVSGRIGQLEQEVAELQERLDFTERVLGRSVDADRLQAGRNVP